MFLLQCCLVGHGHEYEIQTITQVFYPNEGFKLCESPHNTAGEVAVSRFDGGCVSAALYHNGSLVAEDSMAVEVPCDITIMKRALKLTMYNVLNEVTGYRPPWGLTTGIRPSKLAMKMMNEGATEDEIYAHLMNFFVMRADKARLCIDVALAERDIIKDNDVNDVSMYVSIPFCPTRCLYCSFISFPLEKNRGQIDPYLDTLKKELDFFSGYAKNKNLETLYIGGGTPTSLSDMQLESLLDYICGRFNTADLKEFTVEAGRPDTITAEKLRLLKKYNVSRLSINPQTMCDKTLKTIGRLHSAADIVQAFELAREAGFNNINADLIIGLPGEDCRDLQYTLEEMARLDPENITLHALSLKRASVLREQWEAERTEGAPRGHGQTTEIERMISLANDFCGSIFLKPYYMYRQKNTLGNFENVGYAKPSKECIYNVQIMEERQTILAAGASAVTKTVDATGDNIERIFNVKNIDEYISRIDEMIAKKREKL